MERRGVLTPLEDDNKVEGFPSDSLFVKCSKRSDLWHLAKDQQGSPLVMPSETLCGIKPKRSQYETRRSWCGFDLSARVNICSTCKSIATDF
jgi:hypothetical protein